MVLQTNAEAATVVSQEGDVVGSFPDASYGAMELRVRAGDRFFMFSDGLIETGGNREEGIARVSAACKAHRRASMADLVRHVVHDVTQGVTVADDALLMGVEV